MKVFLSKVSIKSNGNVTCVVDLLILSLILNKLLRTNNFNSIVISVLIILFVVSTQQVFSQDNLVISSSKGFLLYCYLVPLDNVTWYARIGAFQLTMFRSLPSCYFKPTSNSNNFTSLLSAWYLFLSFCNIAINLVLRFVAYSAYQIAFLL